jgi:hypothetical protein
VIGRRVELKPHLDLWMRGARFGTIEHWEYSLRMLYIRLDHPHIKNLVRLHRDDVIFLK